MFVKLFGQEASRHRGLAATILSLISLGLLAGASARAEGDPQAGQAKSVTCAACHGADGNSVNPEWPSLAGQHAGYSVRQLQAYKNGQRDNVLMIGQVMALSEQDKLDLSAFYAEQTLKPLAAGSGDLSLGERLYRGGNPQTGVSACIACHGPRGLGNPTSDYPRVSGQHALYLYNTLKDYADGSRQSDGGVFGQMMRSIAARMSDDEKRAVSAYMQGLQ